MRPAASEPRPDIIENEETLDEFLTRPSTEPVQFIKSVKSPLLILGAGGKMGPSLAVLARRAAEAAGQRIEVIAVSRFNDRSARKWLEERGVATLKADLLNAANVRRLPDAESILYLVGLKFGTTENPALTWAVNTIVPAHVCERYKGTEMVALSTGNVYAPSLAARGGSKESDPLIPLGEYANAAVARERLFEYFSRRDGTRIALLRLFYATDLRYGVVRDIADKIAAGLPVSLANTSFNCIWQGDANEMIIRSLALAASPAAAFNLTSTEIHSVRAVAERLAELMGRKVTFTGEPSETALVGNTARLCTLLGPPATSLDEMLRWTASWVKGGGRGLGKPTHFESRDGKY